jgi:hypothetical protein
MPDIISWDKAIGKKVKSSDNEDLGKIQSITKECIQTKEGSINIIANGTLSRVNGLSFDIGIIERFKNGKNR